ncbi:Eukaryotic aspartyl protease family protein [Hirschfeldia incana]|nr:Eukaryotic aspartyl protease family protein [Hirschfeldia incana]
MAVARHVIVLLSVLVVGWGLERCEATGKFSFEVHHMFSDAVKQTLGLDNLVPEKGSMEYFKVLAHRDQLIRGRGLASNNEEPTVTFMRGNRTVGIDLLGSLHYANVSVGTPATWFLVALDTGSDLFWLPCNCGATCIRDLEDIGLPRSIPLNLYSPNASSTSSSIRCSDKRCFGSRGCSSPASICPYQIQYLSSNTSTRGTLVQDVLHLIKEDDDLEPIKANVTLGCGQRQTGLLQLGFAVNGLLGLGMQDYSVPSVLANANIIANSFSMCIGNIIDVIGRISFGDKGYSDQQETPLVPVKPSPTYAVDVTEVTVGGEDLGVKLLALVDTGTSFTHLLETEYDLVTKTFDGQVKDKRRPIDPKIPFEFCYDLSPNTTTIYFSKIIMTFGGGSRMLLRNPLFSVFNENGGGMYCLGILKSVDFKLNIIGQNFLSGYRIVFDRERMVLGWKPSNCYDDESLEATPPPPEIEAPPPRLSAPLPSPPPPPLVTTATPPPLDPRNSTGNGSGGAANLSPLSSQILLLLPVLAFLLFT